MNIELKNVKVSKSIKDNKEQTEESLIEINYDFWGNKCEIRKSVMNIRETYKIEPVKVQIFDTIKDQKIYNGSMVIIIIIFYEAMAGNQSNAKFIDLIYEINKEIFQETYKVIKIDSDGIWHIKNIKDKGVNVTFNEKIK
jgi:hypothetical protein